MGYARFVCVQLIYEYSHIRVRGVSDLRRNQRFICFLCFQLNVKLDFVNAVTQRQRQTRYQLNVNVNVVTQRQCQR